MRTVAYCGNNTALAYTKHGDKIYVDTRDLSLAPHLMLDGDWEPWVSNAFAAAVRKTEGVSVVDVGANFGWYTLLAKRLGAARVWAFEPQPRVFDLLSKSIRVNGYEDTVTALCTACGAENGETKLYYHAEDFGGATTSPCERASVETGIIRLDDYVPALPHTIIKIDVEGHEVDVLRGAKALLEARPTLFVEHHQQNVVELWNLLGPGYKIHHVRHSGHLGPPLSIEDAIQIRDAETLLCAPG